MQIAQEIEAALGGPHALPVSGQQPFALGLVQGGLEGGERQAGALGEGAQGHPLLQAQGIQHELEGQLGAGHLGVLHHGMGGLCPLHVQAGFTGAHLAHNPVGKAEFAVGTGPQAQVVAKLPVVQVVPAAVAGSGVGGDFIPLQASRCGVRRQRVEHGVGIVVFRHGWRVFGKQGVGLDGQVVHRQVGRCE